MENYNLDKQLVISRKFNYLTYALMAIGVITIIVGFFINPVKTWANYLVNNYYFLSLAIGATFFVALQYITQSGWSSAFIRIPQAMANVIPVIAILMLPVIIFGLPELYHWGPPWRCRPRPNHRTQKPLPEPALLHHPLFYFFRGMDIPDAIPETFIPEGRQGGRNEQFLPE